MTGTALWINAIDEVMRQYFPQTERHLQAAATAAVNSSRHWKYCKKRIFDQARAVVGLCLFAYSGSALYTLRHGDFECTQKSKSV